MQIACFFGFHKLYTASEYRKGIFDANNPSRRKICCLIISVQCERCDFHEDRFQWKSKRAMRQYMEASDP